MIANASPLFSAKWALLLVAIPLLYVMTMPWVIISAGPHWSGHTDPFGLPSWVYVYCRPYRVLADHSLFKEPLEQ